MWRPAGLEQRSVNTYHHPLKGGVAVITGAASGFGLETCRVAARLGMRIVMADVQADALARAQSEIEGLGAAALPFRLDIAQAAERSGLGRAPLQRFRVPNFVLTDAGVGAGGLIWEQAAGLGMVFGINLMGVAHGVRIFTPLMLAAAERDAAWRGHVVDTASMAGLVNAPNMGVYDVSKHAGGVAE